MSPTSPPDQLEQQLKIIFKNSPMGIIRYDTAGAIMDYNDKFIEIMGEKSLPVFKADSTCFPELQAALKKAQAGAACVYEGENPLADARQKSFIRAVFNPVTPGQTPTQIIATIEDISSRKKAEEATRKSEEKYRRMAENALDMILRISIPDGEYEYISPASKQIFGYAPEELYASRKILARAIHPEFKNFFKTAWKGVIKGRIEPFFEYKIIHRSGDIRWLNQRNVLVRDENEQSIAVEGIITDITLRKQMERQLKESRKQYKQLSDATFESIFLFDKGHCIRQNKSARQMFGYSDQEAIGMLNMEWIHPDYREKLMTESRKKEYIIHQSLALRKDQTTFPCEIQTRKIDLDGRSIRIIALRDITRQIKAEKEKLNALGFAAEQAKHALVGQIAGKLAHDFNNVLSVIMGNAQLSMVDCEDTELYETLELIHDQTLRGRNLTKNLVAFAKDQEPKQDYFEINTKIDLVLNLLRKDLQDIDIIRKYDPLLPDLLADPGMIEHALVNLIQNSIHALSRTRDAQISITTYHADTQICFELKDNGCGIPKAHLDDIFTPAFTLKGPRDITGLYPKSIKGTGYGMANVKRYIEQHNGRISVESEPEKGTKFTISLPIRKKRLTKKEETSMDLMHPETEKKVLMVEDEPAIFDIQYRVLTGRPFGHKVDMAANGRVAIDLFERNQYDIISLDYVLPGHTNGMEVYHHVRASNPTIPILFISGNIEFLESIKKLKQKDPYIDHLSKPSPNIEYAKTINDLLVQAKNQN